MTSQKGSAHIVIISILLVALLGILSFVFWQNFIQSDKFVKSESNSQTSVSNNKADLETYTSISGSGLTFDYPSTWFFDEPTKQQIDRDDKKATIMILFSHERSIVNGKGSIATSNVCVTFNEMQGNWPFRSQPLIYSDKIADFSVGQNAVSLVESKSNLEASVSPAMQIINQGTSSEHGGAYIALNSSYFLLATAAKNCSIADNAKTKDIALEIEQAHEILKSVRIKE